MEWQGRSFKGRSGCIVLLRAQRRAQAALGGGWAGLTSVLLAFAAPAALAVLSSHVGIAPHPSGIGSQQALPQLGRQLARGDRGGRRRAHAAQHLARIVVGT